MKLPALLNRLKILIKANFKVLFLLPVYTGFIFVPCKTYAQDILDADSLKNLSIEELMSLEVVSVSKVPEKLTETASAVQVITRQDIQRSAASSVPEALRLASNLQVTQLNSHHWIISARGFNSTFSNKLLVMIDGRTVYSPLFAGVFWDAQYVMLEDIDRIEVISGPGGTLWGANAVNGIINIITKNAEDTQGLYVSAAAGSFLKGSVEGRWGGKISPELSYRVYAHHSDRDRTSLADGSLNTDKWNFSQAGFALGWKPSKADALTLEGNFYRGKEPRVPKSSAIDGQSVMGRWTRTFSENSGMIVQAYFDRTWRIDIPSGIRDVLFTYDLDLQHRFSLGRNQHILWGTGYRFMNDKTSNMSQNVGFPPNNRKMHLFSSFIQDEITLAPDLFKLTLGTKLEHNSFSGFELQPSARLAFTPHKQQLLWAAVSRAVRAPSRADVDYHIPAYEVPPNLPSVAGGPDFTSEKVTAYELGWRAQPVRGLSLSLASFYNLYDDLYSVEVLPGTFTYQIQNGVEGYSYGAEVSADYLISAGWRIKGGYTYFNKNLKNKPGNSNDPIVLTNLGSDAHNLALFRSIMDLPKNLQLDITARYMDKLPVGQFTPAVASYRTFDVRLGWHPSTEMEISVAGQNLLKKGHVEVSNAEIPRGVYAKVSLRY